AIDVRRQLRGNRRALAITAGNRRHADLIDDGHAVGLRQRDATVVAQPGGVGDVAWHGAGIAAGRGVDEQIMRASGEDDVGRHRRADAGWRRIARAQQLPPADVGRVVVVVVYLDELVVFSRRTSDARLTSERTQ